MIEKNLQGEVWVFAEYQAENQSGRIAEVSLELIGKARQLADKLGVKVGAIFPGDDVASLAQTLIAHGADNVYLIENAKLKRFTTLPYAQVVIEAIKKYSPQIVLFGATNLGRDLAPRVASTLRAGMTADCTSLEISDVPHKDGTVDKNLLLQIRPAFGGNIVATIINPEWWPQMATVREGVIPLYPPNPARQGKVIAEKFTIDDALMLVEIIERHTKKQTLNLKGSRVIVAGGGGIGSAEGFHPLFELAGTFGGSVGASRAAIDSGWIDAAHQIGQTGTTVRPALYIACGISGAIQHRVGMQDSAKIIAINTDANAPIFSVAHYGIVGDYRQIVPMMIRAFRERA